MNNLQIIILAAGKGTRMKSQRPKVLQLIAGKPMLQRVIQTAKCLKPNIIQVIVGFGANQIKQEINNQNITWVTQAEQLGTGHAVLQAKENISLESINLILYGDVPLISAITLEKLIESAKLSGFALLTAELKQPAGYGRIIRHNNNIIGIVEHGDATEAQLKINEINTGIMAVKGKLLKKYLNNLTTNNNQGEYYLTDIVKMAVKDGVEIIGLTTDDNLATEGINSRQQQATTERYYQEKLAHKLMDLGVCIIDPKRLDIRGEVTTGQDVTIDINVILEGEVTLGDQVTIGANSIIKNCVIESGTEILANCIVENSKIGQNCSIGPFSRIRPETELLGNNKVGNFVEIKKSQINTGSKVNHLSYVGDATIGKNTNIGAGTITCNYDGAFKHQTIIGDEVFVGSGTELVAPISIANHTTIGAGSTLSKDVATNKNESKLVLTRSKLTTINGWQRPKK